MLCACAFTAGMDDEPELLHNADNPWVVILNRSLAESELHRLLLMQHVRVKVSNTTISHTCLYPQSSIAFMLVPTMSILTSWPPTERSEILPKLVQNLEKFSNLHHRCYVLVTSPLMGSHEQAALSLLQDSFLMASIQFLPMHNAKECIMCMQNIAKLTCKNMSTVVQRRMGDLEAQLESEETILSTLREFGFNERECVMVLDGCGGISGLATASASDLLDLNLDGNRVRMVMDLLHSNNN